MVREAVKPEAMIAYALGGFGAPGAAGAPGALGAPGAAGAPGAPGAGAPPAAAASGRSVPHFLHFVCSGGLNAPQDGHFFIISSNDGGRKHMYPPL